MVIPFISATNIGTFLPNQEMQITNYCSTGGCTYANLTSLQLPDGTVLNLNAAMTQNGQNFNYTYIPLQVGTYTVNTCADPSGTVVCDSDTFIVGGGSLAFIVVGILLFGFLIFWGWKTDYPWIIVLGAFGILIIGIYTSLNGVDAYKNSITQVISYVIIGVGLGFGFKALMDLTNL